MGDQWRFNGKPLDEVVDDLAEAFRELPNSTRMSSLNCALQIIQDTGLEPHAILMSLLEFDNVVHHYIHGIMGIHGEWEERQFQRAEANEGRMMFIEPMSDEHAIGMSRHVSWCYGFELELLNPLTFALASEIKSQRSN